MGNTLNVLNKFITFHGILRYFLSQQKLRSLIVSLTRLCIFALSSRHSKEIDQFRSKVRHKFEFENLTWKDIRSVYYG